MNTYILQYSNNSNPVRIQGGLFDAISAAKSHIGGDSWAINHTNSGAAVHGKSLSCAITLE